MLYAQLERAMVFSVNFLSRYFSVDIEAIREYASTFDDIEHLRAEIRLDMICLNTFLSVWHHFCECDTLNIIRSQEILKCRNLNITDAFYKLCSLFIFIFHFRTCSLNIVMSLGVWAGTSMHLIWG